MATDLPRGFTCVCGKWHDYPTYVYAHWRYFLTHTCECGQAHSILCGIADPIKKKRGKKCATPSNARSVTPNTRAKVF
jgi:hypothetical protein